MRLITLPFRVLFAIVEAILAFFVQWIAAGLAPPQPGGAQAELTALSESAQRTVRRLALGITAVVSLAALVFAAGWGTFPLVRDATRSESEATRARAVGWLALWLPVHSVFCREREAYDTLVRVATRDESAAIRGRAVELLLEHHAWTWTVLWDLGATLSDPSPHVRERALDAMVSFAEGHDEPGNCYGGILRELRGPAGADPDLELASFLARRLSPEGLAYVLGAHEDERALRWQLAIVQAGGDERCAAAALAAIEHFAAFAREAEERERQNTYDPCRVLQGGLSAGDANTRVTELLRGLELIDTPACQTAAARARALHPTAAHTIRSLRSYLAEHPDVPADCAARRRLAELPHDDAPFLAARADGSSRALEVFLAENPGHERWGEARQLAREALGQDVLELAAQGRVEVEAHGDGIMSVKVRVRRLVPEDMRVRVPVGTLMVCDNESAQNMVVTADVPVVLDRDGWIDVSAPAACANRPRDVPTTVDRFGLTRSAASEELARLMPAHDDADVSYPVRQAAVWIVTDDAGYDALGILVSRPSYQVTGGTREIREGQAARAMRICAEAGIDLRAKAIWNDRELLLAALEPGDLRDWLAAQE